jgi:hypothetical protein
VECARQIKPNKAEFPNRQNSFQALANEKVRVDAESKRIAEQIAPTSSMSSVIGLPPAKREKEFEPNWDAFSAPDPGGAERRKLLQKAKSGRAAQGRKKRG